MKNKQWETLLYSTVGVGIMFVTLVAFNIVTSVANVRVDLTEDKIYTLSDGSKAILNGLETPVNIRFYCTQDARQMPVALKNYAREVEDLLAEIKQVAGGNVRIEKLNPEPDSDAEDSATLDGIQAQALDLTTQIYMGISVSSLDQTEAIPFLSPTRQQLLEYDILRAISQVSQPSKPLVGVMSSLPLSGSQPNPMMMQMGQMNQQPAWVFYSELENDFELRDLDPSLDAIDSEIDVLLLVHPKNLSDQTLYGIDQFIMRGGKLITFVDPSCIMDDSGANPNNPMARMTANASNLTKLFDAWGIQMDENQVVADVNFVTQINQGNGRPSPAPAVLSLTSEGINPDDVVTSQIDSLVIPFGGSITGTPTEGLEKEVLLHSTTESQLIEKMMAQFSGQQILNDFSSSGKEHALAVRLMGQFKSAFPEGAPEAAPNEDGEAPPPSSDPGDHKTESVSGAAVVVVSDVDMLADQFSVRVQNILGNRIVMQINGNLNLIQGLVEQMAGDSNLIGVRGRATRNRPFTKVKEMRTQAEDKYRARIAALEESLAETQSRLNQLQTSKQNDQRFILSAEQQKEIENFREQEVEAKQELKELRKQLRQDIDALENSLTWMNIAGMPVVVTVFGVLLAIIKKKKTSAK